MDLNEEHLVNTPFCELRLFGVSMIFGVYSPEREEKKLFF